MKAVHIFIGINGAQHGLLVNVPGERQLHQDAVNAVILIQETNGIS